jgi:hypothetical protein
VTITFRDLWRAHPANNGELEPCKARNGNVTFENQCAIRLGECFHRCGVSMESYRGACCWHGHGKRHPLRVEELKLWIGWSNTSFAAAPKKFKRSNQGVQVSHHRFYGKTGIVAFLDFWGSRSSGDHIDLWNGTRMTLGSEDYFTRSREVWFWWVKW